VARFRGAASPGGAAFEVEGTIEFDKFKVEGADRTMSLSNAGARPSSALNLALYASAIRRYAAS